MKKLVIFFFFFSNLVFSQNITVLTPNGSERVDSCVDTNITWDSSNTSQYYNIYYSVNGGTDWVSIATSYNTIENNFEWNVPNTSSVNCLVKITDSNDESIFDISDQFFIIDGALILLYPSGNENFIAGNEIDLIYSYNQDQVSFINIDYSIDDGISWVNEITGTPATGFFSWTVPNSPNNNSSKIRITDSADTDCKFFENEDNFTIISNLNILSPNGGESLDASVGPQGTTVIMNNGPEKLNTGSFYDDGGLTNNYSGQNYIKTISPDFPTNKIRVTFQSYNFENGDSLQIFDGDDDSDTLLATLTGSSNNVSSFQATNYRGQLTFKFLTDNDNSFSNGWDALISSVGTSYHNINWNVVGTSNYFNLDYSINSGSTWTRIVSNLFSPTGVYSWQVPNTPTNNARLRVTDAQNNSISDISDEDFIIISANPFITIYNPNGGEELFPTQFTEIEWASAFFSNDLSIDYSIDNGANWNQIVASTSTLSNSFGWTVPNTPSEQALVRVSDHNNNSYYDLSDDLFTIENFIKVSEITQPWIRCSDISIPFTSGGTSGTYKIEYSIDEITWNLITDSYTNTITGNKSYEWTIPNILTNNLKIRVTDVADSSKTDTSDQGVVVTTPPSPVTLLSPNGGGSLIAGTEQTLSYTYGDSTTSVSFQISYDGGINWESLSTENNQTADGSATFTVPNYPTTEAKVRVIGNQYNGCDYDDSDQVFTIVSSVNIVQPNGGEVWQATVGTEGHGQDIVFSNATRVVSTARVVKSHDQANYTQTFYPDNPLNKLRIRFDKINTSDWSNLKVYSGVPGESGYTELVQFYRFFDSNYDINSSWTSTHETGAITVVTENVSGYIRNRSFTAQIESVGTSTKQIRWDIVGTSNRFDIDYSTDQGATWSPVVIDYPSTTGVYEWQVPNAVSSQARVRVTDSQQSLVVDISDANFEIQPADPVYASLTGSGALWFPTVSDPLKWRFATFNQSTVDLHYSLDQGVTWTEIADNTNYNIGDHPIEATYNWTIPEINDSSSLVLVRVSDPDNNTYNDIYENTIYNYVKVTSPSGETLTRCSSSDIHWKAGATSGVYKIEYSIDDVTWNLITESYSSPGNGDHSYEWTIPNILTNNLKIRVTDVADSSKTDTSDQGVVVTTPPSPVTLLSPNGGGSLIAGTEQTLSYTYGDSTTSVSFQISYDGGINWESLSTENNQTADGSATFTVPNYPTTEAKVRVIGNQYNGCDYDDSDQVFTIVSSVNIVQPNGGEVWQATVGTEGHGQDIVFSNATRVVSTARVVKSHDQANYTQTFYPDNPLNKLRIRFDKINTSDWSNLKVYSGVPGESGYTELVQFYRFFDSNYDINSSWTSTHETGAITVVTENVSGYIRNRSFTAQIESVGTSTKQIRWDIVGTSNRFDIDYSTDQGATWSPVVIDYPSTTGVYEWQVPNAVSSQARVRVTDSQQSLVVDISDANFEIQPADPVYASLTGSGALWFPTVSDPLKWRFATFNQSTVDLHYSLDQGVTWTEIADNTNYNIGDHPIEATYNWTIPEINDSSSLVLVRVSDPDNNTYNDIYENTIYNYVKVTSPSGETLTRCSSSDIHWKAGATSGVYKIEYSIDDVTWNLITESYSSPGNGDHSYEWTIPNILTNNLKIRVTDVADSSKTDTSDQGVVVTTPPSPVTLLSPNGGGSLIAGTEQTLSYTYGDSTTSVSFQISYDGGINWESLSTENNQTADGSATFTVPNYPTTEAKVRVIGNQYNGCDYDDSDQVFTIVSSVNIVQPNGGEVWQATVGTEGHGQDIVFSNATRVVSTARVVKSHDQANYTQTFYPDNPLNKLRIRFDKINTSDWSNLKVYSGVPGESGYTELVQFYRFFDSNYDINSSWTSTHETGAITVVTENVSGYIRNKSFTAQIESVGTSAKQIRWDIVGTSNRFDIDYSTDQGTTWNPVVIDYPSTTGVYEWQVPNAVSSQARVRVTDSQQSLVVDISDANFEIQPADPVYASLTGSGALWFPTVSDPLKWRFATFNQSTVDLHYSLDQGVTWTEIADNTNYNIGDHPIEATYNWTIPEINDSSSLVLVRVSDPDNNTYNDIYENTIYNYVKVTSPSGETLTRCSSSDIHWKAGATSGVYKIEYSIDDVTWNLITESYSSPGNGDHSYEWTIPNILTNNLKIRVTDVADSSKTDTSDQGVVVTTPPSPVTLLSPNGGGSLIAGTEQTLSYTYGDSTTSVSFQISYDGGINWESLSTENNQTADGSATFTVPNYPTTEAKVRVIGNQYNGCDYDDSDQVFTIVSSVNIVQPNGGEVWQATVGTEGHGQDIVFSNATRVVSTARVVKSHDQANYTQTFYPDNPLNKLRIRFDKINTSDWSNLKVYSGVPGESGYTELVQFYRFFDSNYDINSSWTSTHETGAITVVTENVSGYIRNRSFTAQIESVGTSTKQIRWDIVGTSNRFDIDYSTDQGATWSPVVIDYPSTTGVYEWQVPNAVSSQARVRVTDSQQSLVVDISDANFEIQPADPVYASLTGSGALWFPTVSDPLKWRFATFNQSTVDLHYSLDQGVTWTEIADNTNYNIGDHPIEATYNWTIPEINDSSSLVLVRVSDPDNNTYNDIYENTIYNYVKVTSPSGETLTRCSSSDIHWKAGATSGVYKIEYSIDDVTWNLITESYSSPGNGDHSYEWTIPNILTNNLKIRVTDVADSSKTDTSDQGVVVTTPPSPVTLLSPNGGGSLIAGTEQTLSYTYGDSTTSVSFQISYDGGINWESLSTENNQTADGSATFTVPNYPTTEAKVRVIGNQYNGCDYDDSDQVFTIVSSVNIVQPNGGEVWQATVGTEGHGQDIVFSNATRVVSTARVVKSHDQANYTQTFYPDNPLNKLRIRFDKINTSDWSNLKVYSGVPGESGYTELVQFYRFFDSNYDINSSWTSTHETGAITVVTENVSGYIRNRSFTAQIESVGTSTKQIRWDIVGTSNRFDIDYSTDQGATWSPVVIDYPSTTGVYEWQVPNAVSSQARVRVTDSQQSLVVDTSDANFEIQEAPITIINPNGGEVLYYDQNHQINWSYPDSLDEPSAQNISIDYSVNGGISWINIIENYSNNGFYNWTIPDVQSVQSQSLLRIRKTNDNGFYDISDNFFEIRPRIILTSPNDNSTLFQSCTESSITWFGGAATNYKIEISNDAGFSWNIIDNNFTTSSQFNSYNWFIPNTPSEACIVRISEVDNELYNDSSDQLFTIEPSITIISPNENQNLGSNSVVDIHWDSSYTSDFYNIDYSTDYGVSWSNIVTEMEIPTRTYQWDATNLSNNNVILRVSDFTDSCKYDEVPILFGLIDDFNLTNSSIDENLATYSLIGEFSVEGNGSENYTFELVAGNGDEGNSSFQISGNALYSLEQFDHEIASSYNIRVKLTDLYSNEVLEKQFSITINDINDTEYPLGDCNGDFTVSVIDIVILVEYISGQNPTGFFIENSDVNFDGAINVLDIIGIVDIIMQPGSRFDEQLSDTNLEPLYAFTNWDDNGDFHIESESEIAGLQLEFENEFDYELSSELDGVFDHISYQTNNGNFVVLIYSTDGSFISPGNSVIFESLNLTPQLIELNSLGSNSNMIKINIVHNNTSLGLDNTILTNYRVFPNPTSEVVNFDFGNTLVKNANYSILDMYGRVVKKITHQINSNSDILNIYNLSSGVYLINAEINLQSGLIKIINEKIIIE